MVQFTWPRGLALLLLSLLSTSVTALEQFNETDAPQSYMTIYTKNGEPLLIPTELQQRLQEELETWHWMPWKRTHTIMRDNYVQVSCFSGDSSVGSFPQSIFTHDQLRRGAFLLYVLFGVYAFTLLAVVCNDFFIPIVETICEDLNIPQNVAAATFMSVATSCPEFFVNVISTFLTESDMGIGTIVGSAIFNALGVAAIGGLAAVRPISIEKRPVIRDIVIYMINVSVLVVIVWDGEVVWYEAVTLSVMYVLYFVLMFNSMRLFALFDKLFYGCCCSKHNNVSENESDYNPKSIESGYDNKGFSDVIVPNGTHDKEKATSIIADTVDKVETKPEKSIWRFPKENSIAYKVWWVYTWPIKLLLGLTIPNMTRHRKLYPLAFIMCIVWIGINSYFVSWSMTVIGDTWLIPDSVMGMTFLAFGGCVPEACSIFIMSRKGEGGIGVSNALGANSLAILFALGIPWLIKTLMLLSTEPVQQAVVIINSSGIGFIIGCVLVAVVCLGITLYLGKFYLRKSVGWALAVLYVAFITIALLIETGVILDPATIC